MAREPIRRAPDQGATVDDVEREVNAKAERGPICGMCGSSGRLGVGGETERICIRCCGRGYLLTAAALHENTEVASRHAGAGTDEGRNPLPSSAPHDAGSNPATSTITGPTSAPHQPAPDSSARDGGGSIPLSPSGGGPALSPGAAPVSPAEAALLTHVATGILPENQTAADVAKVMADPTKAIAADLVERGIIREIPPASAAPRPSPFPDAGAASVVRFSDLKLIGLRSPAHLAAKNECQPDEAKVEKGRAVHALALGGRPVVLWPGKQRRGKDWEHFREQNDGAIILNATGYAHATGMAEALQAHPIARLALAGESEHTILWQYDGIHCRATPDVFHRRTPDVKARVVDLKTSHTSQPEEFERHLLRSAYHAQLAFYSEALRSEGYFGARDDVDHLIVAVEQTPPYVVTVFRLVERAIEAGTKLWRKWFEKLRIHRDANHWPGYTERIVEVDAIEGLELDFGDEAAGGGDPLAEPVSASREEE